MSFTGIERTGGRRSSPFLLPAVPPRGLRIGRLIFAFLLLLASCDATPDYLRRQAQERRLERVGMEQLDPSGTSAAAGMSILRTVRITPLDPRRIGKDTLSPAFSRAVHRCGTCHELPDPRMRTAAAWRYALPRMERHIQAAGIIPLGPTEGVAILEFLQRHAKEP